MKRHKLLVSLFRSFKVVLFHTIDTTFSQLNMIQVAQSKRRREESKEDVAQDGESQYVEDRGRRRKTKMNAEAKAKWEEAKKKLLDNIQQARARNAPQEDIDQLQEQFQREYDMDVDIEDTSAVP